MVDKALNNVYIWYSGATDVTGKKLAETLGMKHGDKMPSLKDVCMIIGWGTKVKYSSYDLDNIPVLNHPDNICLNRNKLESMRMMINNGVNIAPFIGKQYIKDIGNVVALPVIGRTAYHQGGKGFWNCPTMTHVNAAIAEGADYFQNVIEIKDEYRLHVFGDKVIYAVKKVKRTVEEMEEAYIKHETERQLTLASKNGDELDAKTLETMLRRQAKKFAQDGANMLIRSNRLGWKFASVKNVPKELETEALKAVKAVGLDFGAVDCCIDVNNKSWVLEVNSGPGLEEKTFDIWIKEIKDATNSLLNVKTAEEAEKNTLQEANTVVKTSDNKRESLLNKISLMMDIVNAADEEDTATLNKVFQKMFE